MKIGAVDIGTNSLRSLIIQSDRFFSDDLKFDIVYRSLKTTRIGKDLQKNGYILAEKIDENIGELKKLKKIFDDNGCLQMIVFATEGLRRASNADVFLEKAKSADIEIKVLSGEEEARFTFDGVIYSINKKSITGNAAVIDIGGGSTELASGIVENNNIVYNNGISFPAGCVVMTEKFGLAGFPIIQKRIDALDAFLFEILKNNNLDYIGDTLIGVGGTITALSAIIQKLKIYESEKVHNSRLTIDEISDVYNYLFSLQIDEREQLPGLNDKRGDIIIAGIRILLAVMNYYKFDSIVISDYGIIIGVIMDYLKKKQL